MLIPTFDTLGDQQFAAYVEPLCAAIRAETQQRGIVTAP
jgi:hypothetical protein